jgi:hypothetical protein
MQGSRLSFRAKREICCVGKDNRHSSSNRWRVLALASTHPVLSRLGWGTATMSCAQCTSDRGRIFNSKMAVHFSGLSGIDKPPVFAATEILICLECGFAEFVLPEAQIRELRENNS